MIKKIILKAGKAKPFWQKESLVFSGAINKMSAEPILGEWVAVYDDKNQYIGSGFYNPHSLYRVRILIFSDEPLLQDVASVLSYRFTEARKKRLSLHLPSVETTAYRLLNSEGDCVSGLTVDVFGDCAVVSATAYWVQLHQELITRLLQDSDLTVCWQPHNHSLAKEGWVSATAESVSSREVLIKENGITYRVDIGLGQKTGFYCDQRENRLLLRQYVKEKRVLDCYCYSGAFALNAAYAGAKEVIAIDSSSPAIELCRVNAELNHLPSIIFKRDKAEEYLRDAKEFDVIVLDPPKLAPSQKHLAKAKKYYTKLNELALLALAPKGILLSCSCSNAMTEALFLQTIKMAAERANKKIRILSVQSAGPDHPYFSKAQYGHYLKAIFIEVL